MILVIVVIRALAINRLPKKTFLALWGITLTRLLVPYSVPSAFSVYSLFGKLLSPAKTEPFRASVSAVQPASLLVPGTGIAPSVPTASAASPAVPPYRLVWMAGALVCAAFFTAAYLRCRRELREALPVDRDFAQDWLKEHRLCRSIRLRQSDRISAPLTYGVFCPVILLPKQINWDDNLVTGVTTAFATSGQAAAESDIAQNGTANAIETAMSGYTVMSYTDPADGKTCYSMDDGNTWIPMTDEEFSAASGWDNVEWWTAEEYSAWLEREKVDLQSIIGSRGWTPSTGWFTWTQEMVDETIVQYEQTLRDIQAGRKISKPTSDGDTMILFDYDSDAQTSVTDTQAAVGCKQQPAPELLAEYKTYG